MTAVQRSVKHTLFAHALTQIRRCDDMERIIRYINSEMRRVIDSDTFSNQQFLEDGDIDDAAIDAAMESGRFDNIYEGKASSFVLFRQKRKREREREKGFLYCIVPSTNQIQVSNPFTAVLTLHTHFTHFTQPLYCFCYFVCIICIHYLKYVFILYLLSI